MSWCIDDCLWIKRHCNTECKRLWLQTYFNIIDAVNIVNSSVLEDKGVL